MEELRWTLRCSFLLAVLVISKVTAGTDCHDAAGSELECEPPFANVVLPYSSNKSAGLGQYNVSSPGNGVGVGDGGVGDGIGGDGGVGDGVGESPHHSPPQFQHVEAEIEQYSPSELQNVGTLPHPS